MHHNDRGYSWTCYDKFQKIIENQEIEEISLSRETEVTQKVEQEEQFLQDAVLFLENEKDEQLASLANQSKDQHDSLAKEAGEIEEPDWVHELDFDLVKDKPGNDDYEFELIEE